MCVPGAVAVVSAGVLVSLFFGKGLLRESSSGRRGRGESPSPDPLLGAVTLLPRRRLPPRGLSGSRGALCKGSFHAVSFRLVSDFYRDLAFLSALAKEIEAAEGGLA